MKKLLLALVFCALGVFALDVPFTPVAEIAKDLMIPVGDKPVASQAIAIPEIPAKKGMVVVLKLNCRLVSKVTSGWNQFATIELNGKDLKNNAPSGARLLYRGDKMKTTHPRDKDVPYWKRFNNHDVLLVLYAPVISKKNICPLPFPSN